MAFQPNGESRFAAVLTFVGVLIGMTLVAFVAIAILVEDPSVLLGSLLGFVGPTIAAVLAIVRTGTLEQRADENRDAAAAANVKATRAEVKAEDAVVVATAAVNGTTPTGTPAVQVPERPLRARPRQWGG